MTQTGTTGMVLFIASFLQNTHHKLLPPLLSHPHPSAQSFAVPLPRPVKVSLTLHYPSLLTCSVGCVRFSYIFIFFNVHVSHCVLIKNMSTWPLQKSENANRQNNIKNSQDARHLPILNHLLIIHWCVSPFISFRRNMHYFLQKWDCVIQYVLWPTLFKNPSIVGQLCYTNFSPLYKTISKKNSRCKKKLVRKNSKIQESRKRN